FLVGLGGIILLRRQVMLLALDDDESRMLGVRVFAVRIGVLAFSTLMVTSVICMTGLIGFVGLIAPHIARLALKRNGSASMALAALTGAFILLVADILARSVYSAELPISIFTSLLGIPFLFYFMSRRKEGQP
ncbi:iron ABC transporter permease, partial [Ruminococcaceae bacterium OttesenSCG-928-L11]|nr:iron ABC transporter permease [Ruminococcaceae bacterium OttesenSCG-928-L11]